MKTVIALIFIALLCISNAFADEFSRGKNVIQTKEFCLYNSATGKCITGENANFTCSTCLHAEGATCSLGACTGLTTAELGATGNYLVTIPAALLNNDQAYFLFENSAANATTYGFTINTKYGTNNVSQVGGFDVINGLTQVHNATPDGSAFKLAAADSRAYRPGQSVCLSYGSGAPNGECSQIISCAASVCGVFPAFSVDVPANVSYQIGGATSNDEAPGAELLACPAANASSREQKMYLFELGRNKLTQNSGTNTWTLYNDALASLCTKAVTPGANFELGEAN